MRFGIASASLGPPARRAGVVGRPDLVKRFLDAADLPIVVVSAPVGYGKTTIVALWSDVDGRRFAWVRLDALDDDPVHLIRHIAASLDSVVGVGADLVRVLTGAGRPVDTELLPALGQHLSSCGDVVLVLDDVNHLSSGTSRDVFESLIPYLEDGAQMVFVGRHQPDIALGRRRLGGELIEIGAEELAMAEQEAVDLLSLAGVDLDDPAMEDLLLRAEGWAGGLGLAALAYGRRGGTLTPGFGRDRLVVEYLMDEVLAGLDPATTDFLLRSSVLDRMCPSLLDALLGIDDSSRQLSEIEWSGNLFLVPLDRDGGWYRYHHLFRDALRARLESDSPKTVRHLHLHASELLEARGDIDGAVRHAVQGGGIDRAADLVLLHAIALIDEGRIGVLGQWLDLLGPEAVAHHPSSAVAAAWYAVGSSDATRIAQALGAAERLSHEGPLADGSPSLEVAIAAVRAMVAAEGTPGVLRDTEIVRQAGGPRKNPWWGFATALQGTVASLTGDNERAREQLLAGIAEVAGSPSMEAGYLGVLALVEMDENDLVGAERHARQAMYLCEAHNLQGVVLDIPAYAAAALVAAKGGRAEDARVAAMQARRLLARLGDLSPRSALRGYVALAQAALAGGSFGEAREMVAEAERARRSDPTCTRLNEQLDGVSRALDRVGGSLRLEVTPITAAELRVLAYLPTHLTLKEIAQATHLSRNTVKSHAVAIYRKLGASSRAQAVAEARRVGLIDAPGTPARN